MPKFSMGGSNDLNKMKKFPSILKYLEAHHSEIYNLIEDLGMEGSLIPKRQSGLTFLLPGKTYTNKIRKTMESSKPEDASDMLLSLIIPVCLDSVSAFEKFQDDIPNLLGKRIIVKSISGNKVLIDDGELTLDTNFSGFERFGRGTRGNLAVWDLKGEVEYQKAPPATYKYLKSTKKGVVGKGKKVGGSDFDLSNLVEDTIEKEVKSIKDGLKENGKFVSPMLNVVARILRGLKDDHLKLAARCLLTKCPIIDFFILTKTPNIFHSDLILKAYEDGAPDNNNNVDTIKKFFNQSFDDDCAIISDCNKLLTLKEKIVNNFENSGISINKKICNIYSDLDSTNCLTFEGTEIMDVYPSFLHEIFKNNPGSHIVLDEFKQFLHCSIEKIKKGIPSDSENWYNTKEERAKEYSELFKDFNMCCNKMNDPSKNILSDTPLDKNDTTVAKSFLQSGMFLQFPTSNDSYQKLEDRIKYGGNDDSECIDELNFEKELEFYENSECKLSDSTIQELKAYVSANGQFPTL